MQRRAFLMRASAGVAATAIARPAIAQTGAPVRWRLATSWPKSLDTLYGGVDAMCQRVGQMTDRKFQIQCFAGGEIVPPLQVWDATQNGTVECGHTLTSFNIGISNISFSQSAVPEPATAAVMAIGAAGLLLRRSRR